MVTLVSYRVHKKANLFQTKLNLLRLILDMIG